LISQYKNNHKMKFFGYTMLLSTFVFFTFSFTNITVEETAAVEWLSWEEAAKLNAENPKKIFVDVYTDWCGWCKVMDKKTFNDPKVAAYLKEYFYSVKLDAESRKAINHMGQSFEFREVEGSKRGGIHMLAYSLLEGKMSYPTVVTLNEKYERIAISPGYKEAPMMFNELKFAAEEHYKTTNFKAFMENLKGQ